MGELVLIWFCGWLAIAIMMACLWLVQEKIKQADIVDVGWAFGLAITAIYYAFALQEAEFGRRVLVGSIVGFWGFRLAAYLFKNRFLHPEEDGRYIVLRQSWGVNASRYFFIFFQAQGLLVGILATFFMLAMNSPQPVFTTFDIAALLLFSVSIIGESIADKQLATFRANPDNRGKTCRTGLWRYSRHPNYFFEWLHWWCYPLLAAGYSWGLFTLLAPAIMLFFILKFTGIPPTEARALLSRGDDYRAYQRTTNAFFPWFPKKEAA